MYWKFVPHYREVLMSIRPNLLRANFKYLIRYLHVTYSTFFGRDLYLSARCTAEIGLISPAGGPGAASRLRRSTINSLDSPESGTDGWGAQ